MLAACGGSGAASSSSTAASTAPATVASSSTAKATPVSATSAQAVAPPKVAGVVEIQYWHFWNGIFQKTIDGVIEAFNKTHPAIHVTAVLMPTLADKLVAAVAAGDPPDVSMASNMASLAFSGLVSSLNQVATPQELSQAKDWVLPAIWDAGSYRGKVYGIPMWTQSYAVLWNKDHFLEAGLNPDKLPATLLELDAMAEKLTKKDAGGAYTRLGMLPNTGAMLGAFWGKFYDPQADKMALADPHNIQMLEWAQGYYKRYGVAAIAAFQKTLQGERAGNQDDFMLGKYSLYSSFR